MKTLSPRDGLQDGFDLATPTHIGPDGGPIIEPAVARLPPRPTLCASGPCKHYHRLEIQVEAEDPMAQLVPIRVPSGTPRTESVPGGTLLRHPAAFHTAVHRYCYPSPGIEIELGDVPVVNCNRHLPTGNDSEAPGRYAEEVRMWEFARACEVSEAAEAERVIEESLAATARMSPHAHVVARCPECRGYWCSSAGCSDLGLLAARGTDHPPHGLGYQWIRHPWDCNSDAVTTIDTTQKEK